MAEKAQERGAAPRWERAARILLTGLILLLVMALLAKGVTSAQLSASMFTYPFQFDESEGMIVAETLLLDRGVNIYNTPGPDLFVAAPYPPLYYLLAWPAQHLAGGEPTFKIGRAISILAALSAGLLIFALVWSAFGEWLAGAVAAALWWALGLVAFWGSLVKPDMLALAFGLCGLLAVVRAKGQWVWLALPFFVAAFHTKQTAIAAAVAGIVWLLVTRPRTGGALGAAYALGALGPGLLLNIWTDGGYYWHMYTVHDLPWFRERFLGFIGGFVAAYGVYMLPGVAALLLLSAWALRVRFARRSERHRFALAPLFALYMGMSFLGAAGTGTHGGNHNHLLDLAAACCIAVGAGIAALQSYRSPAVMAVGAAALLIALFQLPLLFSTPRWLGLELRLPPAAYTEGMSNVFQYVTNNPGTAYSDNTGLMLVARKRLWSTDPFTQQHATLFGRWDESKLVAAIRNKQFSQLVFRIDVFAPDAGAGDISPGILQAVRDNYKLDQKNVENIYVPR